MPCFHPLPAWRSEDGDIVFRESPRHEQELKLPCGWCIGCRLEKSRQWALRCLHEASLYDFNCFVTLTYDNENMPDNGNLVYRDFQLFMKKLRKHTHPSKVRFFMGGEYGEKLGRPHFHACLFNYRPIDGKPIGKRNGHVLYESATLTKLWGKGHVSFGSLTFQSAAYVARYCMKKTTGSLAKFVYENHLDPETGEIFNFEPEFAHMSLKPGIGAGWFEKYKTDVYPSDRLAHDGRLVRPPKYYDNLIDKIDALLLRSVKLDRAEAAALRYSEQTPARLAVQETVLQASISTLKRNLK